MKKFTLTALAALLVSGGAMASEEWGGKIDFTGEITKDTCKVTDSNAGSASSRNISVNLGEVDYLKVGTVANPIFSSTANAGAGVTLAVQCGAAGSAGLKMSLNAAAAEIVAGSSDKIIRLTPGANVASNVGIAVWKVDGSTNSSLSLTGGTTGTGNKLLDISSVTADQTFDVVFKAAYVLYPSKASTDVAPGAANATLPFVMSFN